MIAGTPLDLFAGLSLIQMLLLAGGVVGLTILLGSTRRSTRRMQDESSRSRAEDLQPLQRDVETVMVELEQLSREIHVRLDTKIAKLERLVGDADRRIALLAEPTRSTAAAEAFDITLEAESPNGPALLDGPSPHEAIYRLADDGYSAPQIARETGRLIGEIELILSLRRAKQSSSERSLAEKR